MSMDLQFKLFQFTFSYISMFMQLTGLFQFTVRLLAETEARFTSVERINHYIKVRRVARVMDPPHLSAGMDWGGRARVFGGWGATGTELMLFN